jgi:membrane protease YdiL (CAAX protease family)
MDAKEAAATITAIFVAIVALYPMLAARRVRTRLEQLNDGPDARRIRLYGEMIYCQAAIGAAILGIWIFDGRDLADLGFRYETTLRFWATCAFVAVVAAFYWSLWANYDQLPETTRAEMRDVVGEGPSAKLFPRSAREIKVWLVLCASVASEEILYRGFIVWYVAEKTDLVTACIASSLLFALAHGYQGAAGILRTGGIGVVFLAVYLAADSLWPAVALHIVQDLYAGSVGYLSLRERDAARSAASA